MCGVFAAQDPDKILLFSFYWFRVITTSNAHTLPDKQIGNKSSCIMWCAMKINPFAAIGVKQWPRQTDRRSRVNRAYLPAIFERHCRVSWCGWVVYTVRVRHTRHAYTHVEHLKRKKNKTGSLKLSSSRVAALRVLPAILSQRTSHQTWVQACRSKLISEQQQRNAHLV